MSAKKQTLTQQIVTELKRRILEGELKGGERIWAADLTEELDVSMAPVKDALAALQSEGLITNVPRRGAIIRDFSLKEVIDLYDIRALIECEAIKTGFASGRIDGKLINELVRLNELLGQERSGLQFSKNSIAYEFDWQFHDVMIGATENQLLIELYRRLNTQSQLIRLASWNAGPRGNETYDEHLAIIAGLQNGDVVQTIGAIKDHLSSIIEAFRSHVKCRKDDDKDETKDYRQFRARRH